MNKSDAMDAKSAPTPPTILLDHYLKQLKLPSILREYKSLAHQCAQERCDYPVYLLRLVERELLDRERRAAERRIKAAAQQRPRPVRASVPL